MPTPSPRPASHRTPTIALLHFSEPVTPGGLYLNSLSSLDVYCVFCSFFAARNHKHHPLRLAHTAELAVVLHDRKLGFHNPLSNTTFHRLLLSAHFTFSQSIPSPSVSPARSTPVPWAAPALCAGPVLLHGCPARVYFKTTSMFLHGYRG